MLLVAPVAAFKIVTVLATLFATAASPVSWSAATPNEPEPVVGVLVTLGPVSSTTEALLLPLFATTTLCRRGRTPTPDGFHPAVTLLPVPVGRAIVATLSHPGRLTNAVF